MNTHRLFSWIIILILVFGFTGYEAGEEAGSVSFSQAVLGDSSSRVQSREARVQFKEAYGDSAVALKLDHVPIAVKDLRKAERRYHDGLGFSIKPGRLHQNSIDNVHIKFADGSALELITASEAKDNLSSLYLDFVEEGDGGAFISLDGGSAEVVADRLEAGRLNPILTQGSYASSVLFDFDDPLSYFFFIEYYRRPRDKPEHLNHPNTAKGLYAVWLVSDNFGEEKRFLSALREDVSGTLVGNPALVVEGRDIELARGHLYLFPKSSNWRNDRKIAGVTISVEDIDQARKYVKRLYGRSIEVHESERGTSVYVAPALAHGMWIEFLEEVQRQN